MSVDGDHRRWRVARIGVALLIGVATVSAYWAVRGHGFVRKDDPMYLTENAHVQHGLTRENLGYAFTTFDAANWHPLTWLSHMLDWQLFEDNAGAHHMVNVALHALNALLLLAALSMMTREFWPAAAVALLFALHPLRVESVAWAAERKDVLSASFGLTCLIAYAWYARSPNVVRYVLVFVSLALGLLAKPMLVTWPLLLLLLDVWPLRRTKWRSVAILRNPVVPASRLILEKVPLLLLVIASCWLTMIAQGEGGAIASSEHFPLSVRLGTAAISYVWYLGATFWPANLAVFYPHPLRWPIEQTLAALAILLIVASACVVLCRRAPWLLIGWLWFLGTLVPVIGFIQVGSQSRADRYMYLPQIGVLVAVTWTAWRVLQSRGWIFIGLTCVISLALWFQTRHQVQFWRDDNTLRKRALDVTRDEAGKEFDLAVEAEKRGDIEGVEQHLRAGMAIKPLDPRFPFSLANLRVRQNRLGDAIPLFEEAVRLDPDNPAPINNLAWLLATAPDVKLRNSSRALQLATALCKMVDEDSRDLAGYLDTLAGAQAATGRFGEALTTASRALDLAIKHDEQDLARQIGFHIRLYQAGLPPQ